MADVVDEPAHTPQHALECLSLLAERVGTLPGQRFGLLSLGDLLLEADVVGELPPVVQRCESHPIPERRAVLPVVEQLHRDRFLVVDCLAHPRDCLLVGVRALQQPAVAPQHLLDVVTGQVGVALIGIDEGVVRQGGVGDCDTNRRLVDRPDDIPLTRFG